MRTQKTHLQKHRIKAFTATLEQLETRLHQKLGFYDQYSELYHFPKMLTRRNLRKYKRWLKATKALRDIDEKHIK